MASNPERSTFTNYAYRQQNHIFILFGPNSRTHTNYFITHHQPIDHSNRDGFLLMGLLNVNVAAHTY
jgi:hypothetical protein